jgi:hypothetical protein
MVTDREGPGYNPGVRTAESIPSEELDGHRLPARLVADLLADADRIWWDAPRPGQFVALWRPERRSQIRVAWCVEGRAREIILPDCAERDLYCRNVHEATQPRADAWEIVLDYNFEPYDPLDYVASMAATAELRLPHSEAAPSLGRVRSASVAGDGSSDAMLQGLRYHLLEHLKRVDEVPSQFW